MTFLHLAPQLDFFLSSNNDVTRTLAHDSGHFAYPSNSLVRGSLRSLARDATSPLGASPLGARWHLSLARSGNPSLPRMAGRKMSLIIRQSPHNVPFCFTTQLDIDVCIPKVLSSHFRHLFIPSSNFVSCGLTQKYNSIICYSYLLTNKDSLIIFHNI